MGIKKVFLKKVRGPLGFLPPGPGIDWFLRGLRLDCLAVTLNATFEMDLATPFFVTIYGMPTFRVITQWVTRFPLVIQRLTGHTPPY